MVLSDLFSNLTRNLKSKLARHLDPPNHKKKPARPRRIPYRRTNSIATTLTSPTGSTASATSNHLYNAAPAPTPQVYQKDKKRTKELEAELETYNRNIADLTKRADQIRSNPGTACSLFSYIELNSPKLRRSHPEAAGRQAPPHPVPKPIHPIGVYFVLRIGVYLQSDCDTHAEEAKIHKIVHKEEAIVAARIASRER
ncbi:hypothetical protein BC936DRAFT_143628 [Jimgerdemannia flammicorona]|uniref:Uncharacterized protein n=1 Tax=Jimgerdemannia flammicorona TaxID=994334 RepID=A0A432ZYS9_9FUNG|nr:hypothetical protein BC936DRAFT_143628 [Jimgerdemannia flammicorona]